MVQLFSDVNQVIQVTVTDLGPFEGSSVTETETHTALSQSVTDGDKIRESPSSRLLRAR